MPPFPARFASCVACVGLAVAFLSGATGAAASKRAASADPDLARLPPEWAAALKSLASTQDHFRFLASKRIVLRIADPGPDVGADVGATFARGAVIYDPASLEAAAKALRKRGVPREDLARVLAWKTVPTIVHELRHGMNREEIRSKLGIGFIGITVEDEMLAWADQARVTDELRARARETPRAFGAFAPEASSRDLLAAWDLSLDAFGNYIGAMLPKDTLSVLAAEDAFAAAFCEAGLKQSHARRRIDEYGECMRVFKDPALSSKLRRFYQDALEAVAADWSRRHPSK